MRNYPTLWSLKLCSFSWTLKRAALGLFCLLLPRRRSRWKDQQGWEGKGERLPSRPSSLLCSAPPELLSFPYHIKRQTMKDLKMNVIYVKTNQLPFSYPSSADQSAAFSFLGIRKSLTNVRIWWGLNSLVKMHLSRKQLKAQVATFEKKLSPLFLPRAFLGECFRNRSRPC